MRLVASRPDFGVLDEVEQEMEGALTGAMRSLTDGLKSEYRERTASVLGARLGNTWRGRTFPQSGRSLEPSAFVWSKAPKIVDAFDRAPLILPTDGRRYLAIPTDRVPLKGRGRPMTPAEVEAAFDQDLIVRNWRRGRKLAFVDVVEARSSRRPGLRRATARRRGQGRKSRLVLMFVLVPSVQLRKMIDIKGPADRWAARFPDLINRHWRD